MAVNRIELAVECDNPETEGIEVLAVVVEALGLDVSKDVEAIMTASPDGEPTLVAVLQVGIAAAPDDLQEITANDV